MISVILYGRNDSHGYNLHKRGAISLNCIAEVLTGNEDEMLFVDYNSPDQIPTFPEAIADTLTPRAKKLLRIIRVREAYHQQFAGQTHLVALESQSRNIAIRRASPSNRWVLSTNTDMIFVPRRSALSLTDTLAELRDGFYHLPRFEVPEVLWETLDRSSPRGAIERVAQWGTGLHLNEVVYGGFDNVYEAPGDFQLFLREDIMRIGGFDETMIRGWHVDSNIARRMKLLRGEVQTAVEQVFGYHCGHTRQPTSLHRSGFVANSIDTYVRNVEQPVAIAQFDSWGAPDWEFEERRLGAEAMSRVEKALDAAIDTQGPELSEVSLNEDSFDRTSYDPSHVLPHLTNLVSEMPVGQTVLLLGTDAALFEQLAVALNQLDLRPTLLWVESQSGCTFAKDVRLDEGLARADLIIQQFPAYDPQESGEWASSRWWAQRAFESIVAAERERPQEERRLIILVNAAHSKLQDSFMMAMTFTAIPYTARLRHGFVSLPAAHDCTGEASSGRLRPFSEDDLAMLRQIVDHEDSSPGWERLALELPEMVRQASLDPTEPRVAEVLAKAQAHLRASADRCMARPVEVTGRDTTAIRLCSTADWEDLEWLSLAERCFGSQVYGEGARSRWVWERVSLLRSLRANVDEHERPWVLVISNSPDPLPTMTAYFGYRVAFASFGRLMADCEDESGAWEESLRVWNMMSHVDLLPLDSAIGRGINRFAAVILAGTDISAAGVQRFGAVSQRLAELAEPDCYISAAVHVHLNAASGSALSYAEWCALFSDGGAADRAGLVPAGDVDTRIPLDAAVRFAPEDQTQYVPGLSFGWGSSIVTIGILNGRRGRAKRASAQKLDTVPFTQHRQAGESRGASGDTTAVPDAVLKAAADAAAGPFACRIIPGLSRDLSTFARGAHTSEKNSWWIVPLETSSTSPLSVPAGHGISAVATVDGSAVPRPGVLEAGDVWKVDHSTGRTALVVCAAGTTAPVIVVLA